MPNRDTPADTGKPLLRKAPVLKILLCQVIATLVVMMALVPLANQNGQVFKVLTWAFIVGGIAAGLGWPFGLTRWWAGLQVMFPVAVVGALWLEFPPYVWLVLFAMTLLVYWNSFRGGVPLYLSNRTAWKAVERQLPDKPGFEFVDLGGGIGGTVLFLASRRPDGQFISIESAPIPFAVSWLRARISNTSNVRMVFGDIWKQSLSSADVVYAFLSPQPMPELYAVARNEMKPGSTLISNSFDVPDQPANEILELDDRRRSRLHIWRF